MDVKREDWKKVILCLLAMLFIACPAIVSSVETQYPYDQVGIVMGYSGVYDVWLFDKFWNSDQTPKEELTTWLDNIALKGGNIIRIFSHYVGDYDNYAYEHVTISPWIFFKDTIEHNFDPTQFNQDYFKRLGNFMEELDKRKLKAWIDVWDYCSLKKNKWKKHPFWHNTSKQDEPIGAFLTDTDMVKWRKDFQKKLIEKTNINGYNPIFSTNEFGSTTDLTVDQTKAFYKDFTDTLINTYHIPQERISHSPPIDPPIALLYTYHSFFNNEYRDHKFLLSVHGKSEESEIDGNFLKTYRIRVVSSDGESNGDPKPNPRPKEWKDYQNPLSSSQVSQSMDKALKLGFSGMEILDREEYWNSYKDPILETNPNPPCARLDIETLENMVSKFLQYNCITLLTPNGGEKWIQDEVKTISWTKPETMWGTFKIELFRLLNNSWSFAGVVADAIAKDKNSFLWDVGKIKDGSYVTGGLNIYKICIYRVNNGIKTALQDLSDGSFSIYAKPPQPVLSSPAYDEVIRTPSVTFQWNEKNTYPQVDQYYFYVKDNTNNEEKDNKINGFANRTYTITDSTFFKDGHSYCWFVQARSLINGNIYWSKKKEERPFRVVLSSAPPAPELRSPEDGSNVVAMSVLLQWYPVTATPPVTKYHFQLVRNGLVVIDAPNVSSTTTSWLLEFPNIPFKTHLWRVRAYNSMGWGPWNEFTFTLVDPR